MSLPVNWRQHFAQMSLLPPESTIPPPEKKRRRGRPLGGPSDNPVLAWIGYHRVVTTTQILWRFWAQKGKGHRHGNNVLKRLEEQELIVTTSIHPNLGRASPRVVQLTLHGWRYLHLSPPKGALATLPAPVLQHRLQYAETMLVREAEGWGFLPKDKMGPAIQAKALSWYRGRVLTGTEQAMRDAIKRNPPPEITLHGLRRIEDGKLRLLLPVRKGRSIRRVLRGLPRHMRALTDHLEFEIVSGDPDEIPIASELLQQWGRRNKLTVMAYHCRHYSERRTP